MGTLFVDKLDPQSGTSLELGSSGDTLTVPSGATLSIAGTINASSGTATGFGENNTPAWLVRYNGEQSLSDFATTKVTGWSIEEVDTDNAFASDKFTVPSGGAGKYYVYTAIQLKGDATSRLIKTNLLIYKNGSNVAFMAEDFRDNNINQASATISTILDLSVGDYLEVYVAVDVSAGTPYYEGNNKRAMFGGFKVTT